MPDTPTFPEVRERLEATARRMERFPSFARFGVEYMEIGADETGPFAADLRAALQYITSLEAAIREKEAEIAVLRAKPPYLVSFNCPSCRPGE